MTGVRAVLSLLLSLCLAGPAMAAPTFGYVADFGARGPHATVSHAEGPACTVFRPAQLDARRRHPIVLWGNGTGSAPSSYRSVLDHFASHGFVVAAANTPNAGSGTQMLACLDTLAGRARDPASAFFNALDLARVGAAGHSQGGGGAIMAGRDPRVSATAPLQPFVIALGYRLGAEAQQNGPMLLLSGALDRIAMPEINQQLVFQRSNVPVFWLTLDNANHFLPSGDAGSYRHVATAWFRWRLMDDDMASQWFEGETCTLCAAHGWRLRRKGPSDLAGQPGVRP